MGASFWSSMGREKGEESEDGGSGLVGGFLSFSLVSFFTQSPLLFCFQHGLVLFSFNF